MYIVCYWPNDSLHEHEKCFESLEESLNFIQNLTCSWELTEPSGKVHHS